METLFKTFIAIAGAAISFLFGGWSTLLTILLAFVVIDYVTGMIAAFFEKQLNSETGFKGIAKKIAIFFIVAVAHMVDVAMGGDAHVVRDAAIFFYLANELLSITENVGRLGIPLPQQLINAVDILKGKDDK